MYKISEFTLKIPKIGWFDKIVIGLCDFTRPRMNLWWILQSVGWIYRLRGNHWSNELLDLFHLTSWDFECTSSKSNFIYAFSKIIIITSLSNGTLNDFKLVWHGHDFIQMTICRIESLHNHENYIDLNLENKDFVQTGVQSTFANKE